MRLRVRVPVLSTQSTDTAPRVSSAASRRVRTCRRDRRQAPMAGNTVITTGSSSGSSDMARAIPASNARSQSSCRLPSRITSSRLSPMPSTAKLRASRAAWRRSGASPGSTRRNDSPMLPMRLRAPVAHTRAMAWPCSTRVPANSVSAGNAEVAEAGDAAAAGAPSADAGVGAEVSERVGEVAGAVPAQVAGATSAEPATAGGARASAPFSTGSDSPLSSDSSISKPLLSRRMASAGMRSPSATSIKSPTTSSAPGTLRRTPARSTSARGAANWRRAASARSVLPSWYKVRPSVTATISDRNRPSASSPNKR